MDKEDRFWKSEYENLRRKKNKEIKFLRRRFSIFFDTTWNLLKELGMSEEEIIKYYVSKDESV